MALPLNVGLKMKRFLAGDRKRTAQMAWVMNEFCDVFDALLNPKVIRGTTDSVTIGNNGVVFTIKEDGAPGNGNMRYRGEYDPDADPEYLNGDVVRVSQDNAASTTEGGDTIPGVYICIQDGPSDTDFPQHPLQPDGETEFWNWLATWPSRIKVCNPDTNAIEDWAIDGQKIPEVTADSTRETVDSDKLTADS